MDRPYLPGTHVDKRDITLNLIQDIFPLRLIPCFGMMDTAADMMAMCLGLGGLQRYYERTMYQSYESRHRAMLFGFHTDTIDIGASL